MTTDRVRRWPLVIAAAGPLLLILGDATPLGTGYYSALLAAPLLLLLWVGGAMWAGAAGLLSAYRGHWRASLSALIFPAVALVALQPYRCLAECQSLGALLHFQIMEPHYRTIARAAPARSRFFDWGGRVGWREGVLYDVSDRLRLPPEAGLGEGALTARPLGGHFFLVVWRGDRDYPR
jgi:hypothetical protein